MDLSPAAIARIHAAARESFHPRDAQHQYIQFLSVILQYRVAYGRKDRIDRNVCRRAIGKARRLKQRIAKGIVSIDRE